MSFPRYPEYKSSGVEWLGMVPEHWKAAPLKAVSTHNDDVLDESTAPDTEIAYVDISSVDSVNGIKSKECMLFAAAPSRARRRVKHGDVIVSTVRTYLKAIARIRDPEENLIVSTGFAVIRPRGELTPDFLGHLVSARFFIDQVIAHSTGVSYPAINASELVAILVPVPPIPEQTQIAAFLDRETAKIDELVAEQRRLMELLIEKRRAVISHAVTRGLNHKAPTKPSGIEWLGDVPEHWSLPKLKDLASFSGGGTPSRENLTYWNGDIPWVSPKDMKSERIVGAEESITETGLRNSSSKLLPIGRVLMVVRSGILQHTIPVAINEIPVALNQDMKAFEFDQRRVIPEFFMRWVQGLNDPLLLVWAKQGATVESIEQTYLANTVVPMPSLLEQDEIIKYVGVALDKFDTLTSEAQRAIELLQERRTALISAAVTGQIDVRNAVTA